MDALVIAVFFSAVSILVFVLLYNARRKAQAFAAGRLNESAKSLAYFRTMFPELQPHFQPEKIVSFVRARNARSAATSQSGWQAPPGFEETTATITVSNGREQVRLLDGAGAVLAEFVYEAQPQGAALRLGRGKLTAVLADKTNPKVRYWHPEREFKWSRKGGWSFTTAVAADSFDSNREGTSWSDRSSSSTSAAVATGAAAAMVAGAGGAFGGGGASAGWDAEKSGGESGGESGGDTAAGTAY